MVYPTQTKDSQHLAGRLLIRTLVTAPMLLLPPLSLRKRRNRRKKQRSSRQNKNVSGCASANYRHSMIMRSVHACTRIVRAP